MNRDFIEVTGLYKRYTENGTDVLKNIHLSVAQGSINALIGKSGSGKTTLLNIIGGLDRPSSGMVVINGTAITEINEIQLSKFRAEMIGFVFQFFNLIPELTAKENILFQTLISHRKPDLDMLDYVMKALGLYDLADRFPLHLAGGEQQRVAIARALIGRPKLLLMDEPTGNLDEKNAENVMHLVKKINEDTGLTVVYVTHDRDMAEYADRIITIKDGKCL